MRIAVIDGQGGGIGKTLIERLRQAFGSEISITALGTNALATAAMLKAGADEGASGENAVVRNAASADFIMGAVGIIAADSMLGELSPEMAKAVAASPAKKILIPLNRCGIVIAGVKSAPPQALVDDAVEILRAEINGR